jgi:glycosyltransferase 2 family protein
MTSNSKYMGALVAGVKVAITTGVLALVISLFDFNFTLIAQHLAQLDIAWLLLALACALTSYAVAGARWYKLMGHLGFNHPFSVFFISHFKACFFNQLLWSIGGDLIKIIDISKLGHNYKQVFYAVVTDRILGLVGLLLLNLAGLAYFVFYPTNLPVLLSITIALVSSGLIIATVMLYYLHFFAWLNNFKISRLFVHLSHCFYLGCNSLAKSSLQLSLSLITHLFSILSIVFISMSIDSLAINPVLLFAIMPPIILLSVLPISFAGWGIREGALVGLLVTLGYPQEAVLLMSILYGLAMFVVSLPGAYCYILPKKQPE